MCKIFITLLALKDRDHVVRMNAYQIGEMAKKSEGDVIKALEVLSNPDKRRLEPQPFEGRRIKKVEDGWLILNGDKYQQMMSAAKRAAEQAKWQRDNRETERRIKNGEPVDYEKLTQAQKRLWHKYHKNGKSKGDVNVSHGDQPPEKGLADINSRAGYSPSKPDDDLPDF